MELGWPASVAGKWSRTLEMAEGGGWCRISRQSLSALNWVRLGVTPWPCTYSNVVLLHIHINSVFGDYVAGVQTEIIDQSIACLHRSYWQSKLPSNKLFPSCNKPISGQRAILELIKGNI